MVLIVTGGMMSHPIGKASRRTFEERGRKGSMAESAAKQAQDVKNEETCVCLNPNEILLKSRFVEMPREDAAKLKKRFDNAERIGFKFSGPPRKRAAKAR